MKQHSRKPSILVIGSSNTDLIVQCERLPKSGETLLGGEFQKYQGGKGANQAVAAARAGVDVTFVGARGNDLFGEETVAALRREKIDVRHFSVKRNVSSGVALILVGKKGGENMIAVAKSANDSVSPRQISRLRDEFSQCGAVICQLEVPLETVIESAKMARKHRVPFILNPAPAQKLPRQLLQLVHTLIPNEHEIRLLSGKTDIEEGARQFLQMGCNQVVVTLGEKGVLLVNAEGTRHFPPHKVKPVNTVGAGDCFCGWFAAGVAEGLPVEKTIRRASFAAALSVSRQGVQGSFPRRREVKS